jgi:hypothetical protein
LNAAQRPAASALNLELGEAPHSQLKAKSSKVRDVPVPPAFSLTPPPQLNDDMLFNIVIAMLGIAGLRTYEKQKGLTK